MKFARKFVTLLFLVGGVATLHADAPVTTASASDLQARGAQIQQQIANDYRYVMAMQARARSEKDEIKLNCVNDKLIQIKVEMNIADAADQQLQSQIADGSRADGDGSFAQLSSAGVSVHQLRQAAGACVGQVDLENEQSDSSTHPVFPDDPTVIPFGEYVEAPAYASPFN